MTHGFLSCLGLGILGKIPGTLSSSPPPPCVFQSKSLVGFSWKRHIASPYPPLNKDILLCVVLPAKKFFTSFHIETCLTGCKSGVIAPPAPQGQAGLFAAVIFPLSAVRLSRVSLAGLPDRVFNTNTPRQFGCVDRFRFFVPLWFSSSFWEYF